MEEVSKQLADREAVLKELFPTLDLSALRGLDRSQLLAQLSSHTQEDPSAEPADDVDESGQVSENGEDPDRRWDELQNDPRASMKPSDDVNAVSLAYDQHRRSYLGVSSISAILRTIFKLCPHAKTNVAQRAKEWHKHIADSQWNGASDNPTKADELLCIDAYFAHIHSITPMLNENEFRCIWGGDMRNDEAWLSLLNMVCAMGSIAAGKEHTHRAYHARAMSYLNLETFGAGNLESLQALCLLGGYYLQYQNSPNMANALLGAAHRIAIALGLHRESRKSHTSSATPDNANSLSKPEIKRRTWWSLFCLDTWTSMTMGRPTSGRWDPSSMDTNLPTVMDKSDEAALSLRASAEFCFIANRIQGRLAQLHRITTSEILVFDKELQGWHASLPSELLGPNLCSPKLIIARDFMCNRYLNLRLLLYRPILLSSSNKSSALLDMAQQEGTVLEICTDIAQHAIDSVSQNWTHNRVHVWNASWYLFQATMVPLLSLALQNNRQGNGAPNSVSPAEEVLVNALHLFGQMTPWMRSADRSPEIVRVIFEALSSEESRQTPVSDGDFNFFGWYDDELTFGDEIDWGAFLVDDADLDFETLRGP